MRKLLLSVSIVSVCVTGCQEAPQTSPAASGTGQDAAVNAADASMNDAKATITEKDAETHSTAKPVVPDELNTDKAEKEKAVDQEAADTKSPSP